MGTYGTTEEEFKKMKEEMEKELGRELTPDEIEALRRVSE
jgi:DNA replication protein DnaD